MSPLEIVLVSTMGFCLVLFFVYLLVLNGLEVNKINTFKLLNKRAKKHQIVFFGDSLTDFYPIQEFVDDPTIYNRGIAGDTTTDLLNRMDCVCDIEPRKVFLLIGTNDIGIGKKAEFVVHNIDKITDILTERCNGCKIYILSQYPLRRHKNFWSRLACGIRTKKKLLHLTQLTEQLAQKKGYTFIDVASSLTDDKGYYKKEFTIDGLHLTALGYEAVTKVLLDYIND